MTVDETHLKFPSIFRTVHNISMYASEWWCETQRKESEKGFGPGQSPDSLVRWQMRLIRVNSYSVNPFFS